MPSDSDPCPLNVKNMENFTINSIKYAVSEKEDENYSTLESPSNQKKKGKKNKKAK